MDSNYHDTFDVEVSTFHLLDFPRIFRSCFDIKKGLSGDPSLRSQSSTMDEDNFQLEYRHEEFSVGNLQKHKNNVSTAIE